MRKAACRLIYRVYTIHITLAVHSSSISDERNFTIICTVNTVPHTLKLLNGFVAKYLHVSVQNVSVTYVTLIP